MDAIRLVVTKRDKSLLPSEQRHKEQIGDMLGTLQRRRKRLREITAIEQDVQAKYARILRSFEDELAVRAQQEIRDRVAKELLLSDEDDLPAKGRRVEVVVASSESAESDDETLDVQGEESCLPSTTVSSCQSEQTLPYSGNSREFIW